MSYINTEDLILKILATSANNPWILLTEKDTDLYHLVAHAKALAKIINEMPSADVVEVVRCKDCIHSWKHSEDVYECGCFCAMTTSNFYCADGERKESK